MFLQKSPDPAPCSVHRCPIRHFFLFFPHVVHLASSRPPPRQRRYVCVLRVRVRGFLPLRETLRYAHDVCIFFRLFFFFEPFFFRSRAPLPLAKLNSIIKQKKKTTAQNLPTHFLDTFIAILLNLLLLALVFFHPLLPVAQKNPFQRQPRFSPNSRSTCTVLGVARSTVICIP